MNTRISTTIVRTQASVAGARHRAFGAWSFAGCSGTYELFSTMPNTKHPRLREPSQE